LHIGGVRTALYNWLFARRHGGQFILRIDDTDAGRNVEAALAPILHGFGWLGIDWDEGAEVGGPYGPYYQSRKLERYQDAARQLVERGLAYWDYATKEELEAEREPVEKAKQNWLYSRRWMAKDEADRRRFEAEGRKGVVRLKMPREGRCEFTDLVRGETGVDWCAEQDHVIQRADGTCLYNLASVVDDHDMKITHVIRAQEHLSNTPRQIFIARGLGYDLPHYAHLPFVAEPGSQNKLSKRKLAEYLRKFKELKDAYEKGAAIARAIGLTTTADTFNPIIVDFYEQVGYLPEAILNYLVLIGWSLDGTTEFLSRDDMIRLFGLERVNKSPASFDIVKLENRFQKHYMDALPAARKVEMCLPYLEKANVVASPADGPTRALLHQVVVAAGDRVKVFGDIVDFAYFFVPDERVDFDAKAVEKHLVKPPGAKQWLAALAGQFAALEPFDAATIEAAVRGFVEANQVRLGDVSQALRVATTGRTAGFGTFETLALLGRERCLSRLRRALAV
jgi:glutamyl-tRNA synthetase